MKVSRSRNAYFKLCILEAALANRNTGQGPTASNASPPMAGPSTSAAGFVYALEPATSATAQLYAQAGPSTSAAPLRFDEGMSYPDDDEETPTLDDGAPYPEEWEERIF